MIAFGTTDHAPIPLPYACYCCKRGTGCGWTGPRECDPAGTDLYVTNTHNTISYVYDIEAGHKVSGGTPDHYNDYVARRDCRPTGGNAIVYFNGATQDNCYSYILPTTTMPPNSLPISPGPNNLTTMLIYRTCEQPLDQLQVYCPNENGTSYKPLSWFYVHEGQYAHSRLQPGGYVPNFLPIDASRGANGSVVRGPVSNRLTFSTSESSIHLASLHGREVEVSSDVYNLRNFWFEGGWSYGLTIAYNHNVLFFHDDSPCPAPRGWYVRFSVHPGISSYGANFYFRPVANALAADIFDPFDLTLDTEIYYETFLPPSEPGVVQVDQVFPNATVGECRGSLNYNKSVHSPATAGTNYAHSENFWDTNETITLTEA